MFEKITRTFFILLLTTAISEASSHQHTSPKTPLKKSVYKGIQYLRTFQKKGCWSNSPDTTALCLQALLSSPFYFNPKRDPFLKKPLSFLQNLQDEDGAIYDPKSRVLSKSRTTSLAILAMVASADSKYKKTIQKAQDYLVRLQSDEEEGYDPKKDHFYGGIGYGNDERPDLSSIHLSLEALRASGLKGNHSIFKKSVLFIQRCQDGSYNGMKSQRNSWGFTDSPYHIKQTSEKKTSPYGSLTFAGIKSLIHCGLSVEDTRIVGALGWVRKNYTVKSHPGLGENSIYEYYQLMSKTFKLLKGTEANISIQKLAWSKDLEQELLSRQLKDGSWKPSGAKLSLGSHLASTAYAIQTLNLIYQFRRKS